MGGTITFHELFTKTDKEIENRVLIFHIGEALADNESLHIRFYSYRKIKIEKAFCKLSSP